MAKKKKDLIIVTIRSDEIDETIIKEIRKQFKKAYKGKSQIAIFGIGEKDSLEVHTVKG